MYYRHGCNFEVIPYAMLGKPLQFDTYTCMHQAHAQLGLDLGRALVLLFFSFSINECHWSPFKSIYLFYNYLANESF